MPTYESVRKAAELLNAARSLTEQKLYLPKGTGDEIEALLKKLRSEAYDLLQGKVEEAAVPAPGVIHNPGPQFSLIDFIATEEMAKSMIQEIKKKFPGAEDEEPEKKGKRLKKDAGSAQQPTQPSPSMPKVTPAEAAPAPTAPAATEALVDVVATKAADIPGIPEVDDTPSNVTKGMRAPPVVLPEDTTKRRPTLKG